jgi:large subunit ribosomal protein L30
MATEVKRVRIRLVRSPISCKPNHRRTVEALGLRKMHAVTEKNLTPAIQGMIDTVSYLLEVEEIQ